MPVKTGFFTTSEDIYVRADEYNSAYLRSFGYFILNGKSVFRSNNKNSKLLETPMVRGKNFTIPGFNADTFNATATFKCGSDGFSGLYGPAYADYRAPDLKPRGQYLNLESYVHFSAPPGTI